MTEFSCIVCERSLLRILPAYERLPRVTSDCKPWPAGGQLSVCESCGAIQKLPDRKWLDEIGRIYRAYEIYHLSGGAEQVIFAADGQAVPRSRTLADFVTIHLDRSRPGRMIDIGCGNGSALANFSRVLGGWSFEGSELQDIALPVLQRIHGFAELHVGPIERIEGSFDLVSMIHSLEHMVSPAEALCGAARLLAPGGHLFVEVPDIETSPFDLIVADHLAHFSRATSRMLLRRIGFEIEVLDNTVLPKEISMMAGKGQSGMAPAEPVEGVRIVEAALAWLASMIDAALRQLPGAQNLRSSARPSQGHGSSAPWARESISLSMRKSPESGPRIKAVRSFRRRKQAMAAPSSFR
jgi:SAM-dependent methyltransferase